MSRIVLQNGDIFTAEIANAIGNPIVDGDDFIGHGPKVIDSYLDDTPGQIKSNFYAFYNRLKVSHQSGLTFTYLGGIVLLADGLLVSISPGSINIPDNVTRYIYVGSDGTVQAASILPNISFPLAKLTTSSGTLSGSIIDLRDKLVDRVAPADIPVTQLIPPGAMMDFGGTVLPSGWLWQDGSFYAPSTYPALFAAIGYTYGQSGSNFRVPDSRGRATIGVGAGSGLTNRTLGQIGGLETVALNTSQIPSHTHSINDVPHTHSTNESPHSHGVNEPAHGHSLSPYRLYAEGNGTRGDGAELTKVSGGSNTYPNTAQTIIGISINSTRTNLSLNTAFTGINTTNSQGGGGAHENMSPWLATNKIIKY